MCPTFLFLLVILWSQIQFKIWLNYFCITLCSWNAILIIVTGGPQIRNFATQPLSQSGQAQRQMSLTLMQLKVSIHPVFVFVNLTRRWGIFCQDRGLICNSYPGQRQRTLIAIDGAIEHLASQRVPARCLLLGEYFDNIRKFVSLKILHSNSSKI